MIDYTDTHQFVIYAEIPVTEGQITEAMVNGGIQVTDLTPAHVKAVYCTACLLGYDEAARGPCVPVPITGET